MLLPWSRFPVPHRLRRSTCAALLLPFALTLAACDRGSHPDRLDRPAPQFVINDGAHTVDLHTLRGRVVLVNLWASWCAPCVEELPSLLELHHQIPSLAIVAVSTDRDDVAYHRFLSQHRVDLLTVRDPDARINALYGTVQIPETYVIDRDGVLRRKFIGAQNWTSPELLRYLRQL